MDLKKLVFLLLFLPLAQVFAQEGTSLWSSVDIKKKITKKTYANIGLTTRHPENVSYLQTYFFEGSLGFKPNKIFDISVTYRNIHRKKNIDAAFKKRYRYYADMEASKKLKKLKISDRIRYQHQFKDNDVETSFDASYIRNKINASYAINKNWDAYLSADFFYNVQNKEIDQIRPKIGSSYSFAKHHTFDLGLLQNRSLIGEVHSGPIVAIGYQFKF